MQAINGWQLSLIGCLVAREQRFGFDSLLDLAGNTDWPRLRFIQFSAEIIWSDLPRISSIYQSPPSRQIYVESQQNNIKATFLNIALMLLFWPPMAICRLCFTSFKIQSGVAMTFTEQLFRLREKSLSIILIVLSYNNFSDFQHVICSETGICYSRLLKICDSWSPCSAGKTPLKVRKMILDERS